MPSLDAVEVPAELVDALPAPTPYGGTPELAALLIKLVVTRKLTNVLEFGAGASSVAIARALEYLGGGRLTSIEERPEWCAEQWAHVERCPNVDARLLQATLRGRMTRAGWLHGYWNVADQLGTRGPFDLVLVDAPQFYFGGRDSGLWITAPHLKPGAVIVADDADRPNERAMVRHWLQNFPGLTLEEYTPAFGGKGVAILQCDSNESRTSLRVFAGTTLRACRWWLSRVKNSPHKERGWIPGEPSDRTHD